MIYWIQEAASSWPSLLLTNGVAGALAGLVGVVIGQLYQQRRHRETLEITERRHSHSLEQTAAAHEETLRHTANLEAQRAHEAALQKYFEQVGKLLIEQPLRDATPDDNLSTVVRAQTLAVLEGLDPIRKRILLQFLYESNSIRVDKPIISLAGANLRAVEVSSTTGSWANLSEANLSRQLGRGQAVRY